MTDYINDSDLETFQRAIDNSNNEKVIAASDWTPFDGPIRRLEKNQFSNSWGYRLLRWPILLILSLYLSIVALLYGIMRIYVAVYENMVTWRGKRQKLRVKLRSAASYREWVRAAKKLDDHLGNSDWKKTPESEYYDSSTVKYYTEELQNNMTDPKKLGPLLEDCVRYNFAGTLGVQLYSQCYYGTKRTVENFNQQLINGIEQLGRDGTMGTNVLVKQQLQTMARNLGHSALCLSGGACFTYRHFGVVKALLDADLLPDVISGTSGGGLVAAFVCTRTDQELKNQLSPEMIAPKITACWEKFPQWYYRYLRTGARFDSVDWARRAQWFTLGSLTFREAYERTGRILNVSTVPEDSHSPVILCNYITSPDTVIWSALLASAAVPGILNPVVMMMKVYDKKDAKKKKLEKKSYKLVPFRAGTKWKDGSLRNDIPIQALNTYFNVNFTIVSQVNPHVSLFIYAPRGTIGRPSSHRKGKGWRGGFVGSAIENALKLELIKCLKIIKNMTLLPRLKDQDWSSVWLQKFVGTVTVWPRIKLKDFWHILDDPTPDYLKEMMISGETSMYPRLLYIEQFMKIERALGSALQRVSTSEISTDSRASVVSRSNVHRAKSFIV